MEGVRGCVFGKVDEVDLVGHGDVERPGNGYNEEGKVRRLRWRVGKSGSV